MQAKFWIFIGVVLASAVSSPVKAEEVHSGRHAHGTKIDLGLQLNQGQKWKTDEPLRSGMTAIRTILAKDLKAIRKNGLKDVQYAALGEAITPQVAEIFKNCKLGPDADAMLHIVLTQVLNGLTDMKDSNALEVRQKGALQIVHALSEYGDFFEHPGFKNLPQ